MQEISDAIRETLDDTLFSRTERRDIKQIIAENDIDNRQMMWLSSEVFKMAKEKLTAENGSQTIDWLENAMKVLRPSTAESGIQTSIFFSPGDDCLNAILREIKGAHQTLHICVFTISDNRISDAIVDAHKRGVSVKIVTDNDKMFDKGSDIHSMEDSGVPIRQDLTDNHMHHKYAVIDKARLITGSYNWTRSAEKYNQENILITDNDKAIQQYLKEFDRLWKAFE